MITPRGNIYPSSLYTVQAYGWGLENHLHTISDAIVIARHNGSG